jgi:dihydroorotate dehydrogenase electron transfer subunit
MGAKTKSEVFFEKVTRNIIRGNNSSLLVCTDDGSYGIKGTTVTLMGKLVRDESFDCVYTCGPELMMKAVLDISNQNSIPVQASLERYMKCGIGICGSCCLDSSLVCQDGTVFDGRQLSRCLTLVSLIGARMDKKLTMNELKFTILNKEKLLLL